MSTTEKNVTVNHDQELYVIEHDGGYSCLGFDVCIDRAERIGLELTMRRVFGFEDAVKDMPRGSIEVYDTMQNMLDVLKRVVHESDEAMDQAIFDLSPQLRGKEGWRVEVVDEEGDKPRRFIVGKSTGWAPVHLEISRRNAHGGPAARREYRHVRPIEKVR